MNYPIQYSSQARADLENIWDVIYSVSGNYDVADNYIDGILDSVEEKRKFPRSGAPLIYRGLFTGFYSALFKKYLAFYRVWDGSIQVARVLLATSDYVKVLFGDLAEE